MKQRTITFAPERPMGPVSEQLPEITCNLEFEEYGKDKNWKILLIKTDDTHYGCATITLPGVPTPAHLVLIKDYSENAGVLDALINANVLEKTEYSFTSGFVEIPLCKFTKELIKELGINYTPKNDREYYE